MSNFGIRIKTLCLEKGIAQKDLAERIGVSRQSLYLWIKGERTPDKENIQKLAEFFNVSPESILSPKHSGYLINPILFTSFDPD